MSDPTTDYVEVHGERIEVVKTEYASLIDQTASTLSCTHEEAWGAVKEHLAHALADQPAAKRPQKSGPPSPAVLQSASSSEFELVAPGGTVQPIAQVEQVERIESETRLPRIDTSGGHPVLYLNGAALSAIRSLPLSDLGLKSDASVLEAITNGDITLADEHPDVRLLRAAASPKVDFGMADPTRRAAVEAIQQRQYRFPFHEPTVRIMSTDLAKTSLFHVASNNTPRRFCRDEPLGRIGDSVSLVYRGEELRHDDELVLMQLMQVARGKFPGEWFGINNVPFFKGSRGVSRTVSAKDTAGVLESLKRFRGGFLLVKTRKSYFTVNLVSDMSGVGSQHMVMIDPVMVLLYSSFTALDTDKLFKTTGVSRQLLKYISTIPSNIEQTHPIKVLSLYELCYGTLDALGRHYLDTNPTRTDADMRLALSKKVSDFRRKNLPAGLDFLKEIGAIVDYTLDVKADKVVITRAAQAPGVKFLAGPAS
ncbi:hypothetical protein R70006_04988 [Paraburkholderia domus]|uniref:plasmid replication initiator TrfA n=1 Tax=Paraburkholderia domus TaxID=2793075 RepID=UPI001914BDE7|nr:plasmid replication initiator TrfA [Paraburkholderia domus]MBK5051775.1 hypothetical protein [Burkholderia sp. R-70006]CAE6794105.1 hypothetical protein R70006_04988 [Paraburkholderia domus]